MVTRDNVRTLPAGEPTPPPGGAYSMGYTDGMAFGQKCANERFFWLGVMVGCLVSAIVILAVLRLTGGAQ